MCEIDGTSRIVQRDTVHEYLEVVALPSPDKRAGHATV